MDSLNGQPKELDTSGPNMNLPDLVKGRVLTLVAEADPILKTSLPLWNFSIPTFTLINDLHETMKHWNAFGLAANQIGSKVRVFVMRDRAACYNPEILEFSDTTIVDEEGCLSYPGLFVPVKRAAEIKVVYQNLDGDHVTETLSGMNARVFQHELDHLNGIVMLDRANLYHRTQAIKKRMK